MRVIGVVLLGYVASCATSEDATGSGPPSGTGGAAQDSAPNDAADSSTEDAASDAESDSSVPDASDAGDAEVEDASEEDAPTDAAPDVTPDVGSDAPLGCQWVPVAACDTGGTIAQFCSGTVKTLRRCDQTLYIPDAVYLQFHLCSCSFQACGCNGVVWDAVECCN